MNYENENIVSREQSSMVSCWTEHLCLAPIGGGRNRLFTGQYEALAELNDYYNEETEDYDLPDEIDGKIVNGFQDEYVVGGDLQYFESEEAVEFSSPDEPHVSDWLYASGWNSLVTLGDLSRKVNAQQQAK